MGHCPMSKVYEKYYDQGLFDLNVVAMLIDGDDGKDKHGKDKHVAQNHSSLSLHRAELVRQCKQREQVLDKFVNDHNDVKAALESGDSAAHKIAKKRVRRYTLAALLSEERELQKETRTVDDIKSRIVEMKKPGYFEKMIQAKVAELQEHAGKEMLDDLATENEQDSRDNEEEVDPRESIMGVIHVERRCFNEGDDEDYDNAGPRDFSVFIDLLLSFEPEKEVLSCSLCAESPFRTKAEKEYIGGVREHKEGIKHTPYDEWRARMEYLAEEAKAEGDDRPYECPHGCGLESKKFGVIRDHVRWANPFDEGLGEDHDPQVPRWLVRFMFLPEVNDRWFPSRKVEEQETSNR